MDRYPVTNPATNTTETSLDIDIPKTSSPYVENNYSLKLVSFLREQGHSSGKIRQFLVGSSEKVKRCMVVGRELREKGSMWGAIIKSTYGWCGMKKR